MQVRLSGEAGRALVHLGITVPQCNHTDHVDTRCPHDGLRNDLHVRVRLPMAFGDAFDASDMSCMVHLPSIADDGAVDSAVGVSSLHFASDLLQIWLQNRPLLWHYCNGLSCQERLAACPNIGTCHGAVRRAEVFGVGSFGLGRVLYYGHLGCLLSQSRC